MREITVRGGLLTCSRLILSVSVFFLPILEIYGIKGPEIYPVLPKVSKKQFGQLNRMMMSQQYDKLFANEVASATIYEQQEHRCPL